MKNLIATFLLAFSSVAYADMQLGVSVYPNNLYAVLRSPTLSFVRVQAIYGIKRINAVNRKKFALGYQTQFLKTTYLGIISETSVGYVQKEYAYFDAKAGLQTYYKSLSLTAGMGILSNLTSKNIKKNETFSFGEASVSF